MIASPGTCGGVTTTLAGETALPGVGRRQLEELESDDPESPQIARLGRDLRHLAHLKDFALPIIETVAALPITPGGLGTREKLFDDMLTSLADLSDGVAPSISMLGYFCIAFWGVVGGIFYLFYRPSKSQRAEVMAETRGQLRDIHIR